MADSYEAQSLEILRDLGLEAEKLEEEQDRKTPDFLVKDGEHTYLIEQKTKLDDEAFDQKRSKALDEGEVFSASLPLSRRNTISGLIRSGCEQLQAATQSADFRLLWLLDAGQRRGVFMQQFQATLYGMVNLLDMERDDRLRSCFYFTHCDFFRYRDLLDGAILCDGTNVALCLNAFSPRVDALRSSFLASKWHVQDPEALEQVGEAFILDSPEVDRKSSDEALAYVQHKYGRPNLIDLNFVQHSAEAVVPKPEDSGQGEPGS